MPVAPRGTGFALELRGVSFAYRRGSPVLRDVDLAVRESEFVAVAGPNGGGKTTLVRIALGLERPTTGEALLFGRPPERSPRRSAVGYLAQRAQLGLDARASVWEVVTTGTIRRGSLVGRLPSSDRKRVEQAIERVGLSALASRPLAELSGGQQQRAFIAKALARAPALLVLDEPTVGVDAEAQEALASLLADLRAGGGLTILYLSHEFGAIEPYVQRLVLVRGGIAFDGPPSALPALWHDPSHPHA